MASSSFQPSSSSSSAKPLPYDLFAGVHYYINDDIDEVTQQDIRTLLWQGSGCEYDARAMTSGSRPDADSTSARFNLDTVTHVLANSIDFPEYQHCIEPTLLEQGPAASQRPLVVTPQWVRRSAQLAIRLKEDRFSCRSDMIFSGLCVAASKSELSKADRELISSIVAAYGGLWREDHFFDVNVFLTTNTSSTKLQKIINAPGKQTICVAPQWISDSWRLQKLLPLDSYQFLPGQTTPPPCFAGRTASGSPLSSPRKDRVAMSLVGENSRSMSSSKAGEEREKSVFRGKSVLLARDVCRASEQQLRSLEHFVRLSGGTLRRAPNELNGIAQAVRNSDFVVCRYREVQEFREAIRQGKQVGNLTWLIWVVSNDVLSDPREEPLHFPVPRQGIAEFKDASITISGYRGTTRQYLTKMIKLMGATFSGALSSKTSLCVAANLVSEKTTKAKEWDVPIVNHKYIVDSFLAWAPVERARLKYIDFPEDVDYNTDVGDTRVTDESLGPWIDDAIQNDEPEDLPTSDPVTPAVPYTAVEESAAESAPSVDAREVSENLQAPQDVPEPEAAHPGSSDTADTTGTSPPATPSLQHHGMPPLYDGSTTIDTSSEMPSSPGRSEDLPANILPSPLAHRGTKRSRMSILQDSVRQPTTDYLEARAVEHELASHKTVTKRSRRSVTPSTTVPSSDDARSNDAPLRIATSNYKLKKPEETKLKALGIEIVDDIEMADVLVTPKVSRSPKMLYAIASGSVAIVSPDWLQACLKRKECVSPRSESGSSVYDLVDKEGEKTYGIVLADVMRRRASEFTHGIYHGHRFWLGRGVDENGSFSTLIEAAGGQVLPVPFDEDKLLSEPETYHLIVGEDHTIEWRDLVGMPTVKGEPLRLYKKQLITDCIFEQQPRWDRHLVDAASGTPVKKGRGAGGKRAGGR
ncbi:BRCT domain protein [Kalmanozyma brasiliensis GHG001]|nr:BRCT domain protein [Kalmanozyma brasiliensis GHG001]EST04470.1 BRCT domain protein [Kalmanozyma brasiliensis GHG001]